MKEFVATLYFDSAENALEAGYCEAVESTPRMVVYVRGSSRLMT